MTNTITNDHIVNEWAVINAVLQQKEGANVRIDGGVVRS